ncbi:MAG: AAA family ATPase [Lachnospiraceae bacterium]|nr:AAA family ATPase [Lachnospiraceae bacterium]
MMNRNVFFLLGCPCSGKTTVGKILAQKYNMYYFSGDEKRFYYYRFADASKHKYMTKNTSDFWDWSLAEMVDWEKGVISEQTPYILEDLNKLSEHHEFVLFEGMLDMECLSNNVVSDHIVYLTVERNICEKEFFSRKDHNAMITAIMNTSGISDAEKMRRIEMRKAAAIDAFYEKPEKSGIQSYSRSDIMSPSEMAERIEKFFGLTNNL